MSLPSSQMELAKFTSITRWQPKIGDFIIWHGWFSRWYGVVNALPGDQVSIIKDGLPCLLFTMPEAAYSKNTTLIPVVKILGSRGGEFHVLQNNIWFIS